MAHSIRIVLPNVAFLWLLPFFFFLIVSKIAQVRCLLKTVEF